ncbi:MAG TPA: ribonuclease H family protein [Aggregatilineales bacterium]|nr:viroplasmin family protein [Anaerolineales bacterium]HRE47370.1 ribonuclease H family protein [Aggregatilineales bacterium]
MAAKPVKKWYVVWAGRTPGIYETWAACEAQVKGFPQARHKAFLSLAEAKAAFEQPAESYIKKGTPPSAEGQPAAKPAHVVRTARTAPLPELIWDSWAVDAACAGVPGPVEYRGVDTYTKEELFRVGPYPDGTNNIGEFLAIVHALALLTKAGKTTPVYSDSRTAISWVRQKKCKTTHLRRASNDTLFELVERAEKWLNEHEYSSPVLKWETSHWGENPADFGRK